MTATAAERGSLNQGIYSLAELQAYVALHGTADDGAHVPYWLARSLNPSSHRPHAVDYSFADLISLLVVRELSALGVSPAAIRRGESYGRRLLDIERPFVFEDVLTDGREVFFESTDGQLDSSDREGQQVAASLISDLLTRVTYSAGRASSWSPSAGIVLDPRVQFGEPVLEDTRLTTADVASLSDVIGVEQASSRLDVEVELAKRAVAFERSLVKTAV